MPPRPEPRAPPGDRGGQIRGPGTVKSEEEQEKSLTL